MTEELMILRKMISDDEDFTSKLMNYDLSPKLIKKIEDLINWSTILNSDSFNMELAERYFSKKRPIDQEGWETYSQKGVLYPEFLTKNRKNLHFKLIAERTDLTESIILEFKEDLAPYKIQYNDQISYEFLSKNVRIFNLKTLHLSPNLPTEVLSDYEELVDWKYISEHHPISLEVAEQFKKRLHWNLVKMNSNVEAELVNTYPSRFYLSNFVTNLELTEDTLRYGFNKLSDKAKKKLLECRTLSDDFLKEFYYLTNEVEHEERQKNVKEAV
jgi:hypothetical protein